MFFSGNPALLIPVPGFGMQKHTKQSWQNWPDEDHLSIFSIRM